MMHFSKIKLIIIGILIRIIIIVVIGLIGFKQIRHFYLFPSFTLWYFFLIMICKESTWKYLLNQPIVSFMICCHLSLWLYEISFTLSFYFLEFFNNFVGFHYQCKSVSYCVGIHYGSLYDKLSFIKQERITHIKNSPQVFKQLCSCCELLFTVFGHRAPI